MKRKEHISRIDKVFNQLLKYPTHHERVWELLTTSLLKQITYEEYELLFYRLNKLT